LFLHAPEAVMVDVVVVDMDVVAVIRFVAMDIIPIKQ
jgi:hypothetical protein